MNHFRTQPRKTDLKSENPHYISGPRLLTQRQRKAKIFSFSTQCTGEDQITKDYLRGSGTRKRTCLSRGIVFKTGEGR